MKSMYFPRVGSLLSVLTVSLLLAGCGGGGEAKKPGGTTSASGGGKEPLPEPPAVADCEPGKYGGRLVIATFGEPKTFNPITANENSSTDVIQMMFSPLLQWDAPKQELKPGLAESWSVAEDKVTWTFKLRKGLRWSDGQPLNADDVLFTFNDVVYNKSIVNVTVDALRIDGKDFVVSKTDDYTVKIVTPGIYAPFAEIVGAGVYIVPKHILGKAVAEKRFEAAYGVNAKPEELVVNGPFKLKQFKPGEYTLLERNPNFWEVDSKSQRLPYLDNVAYVTVPDFNAMSLRFLKGESDVQDVVRPDEMDKFNEESKQGKFKVMDLGIQMERGYIWFNQNTESNPKTGKPYLDPKKQKWFRNTKFRQAINMALDRESIIKSIYAGRAKPVTGFISPANKKWFNEQMPQPIYDVAKAKAMLAEIGIQDRNGDGILEDAQGNPIEFTLNTNAGNTMREKMAVIIQDDMKRLGIKLSYQPLDFNALIDRTDTTFDYDCVLMAFGGDSTDPVNNMNMLRSDGFTHVWFPRQKKPSTEWEARIDELMNLQLKTLDFAERKKYFDEVQAILQEQQPMVSIVSSYAYCAARSDLGNLRPTPLHGLRLTWNIEQLYFKK